MSFEYADQARAIGHIDMWIDAVKAFSDEVIERNREEDREALGVSFDGLKFFRGFVSESLVQAQYDIRYLGDDRNNGRDHCTDCYKRAINLTNACIVETIKVMRRACADSPTRLVESLEKSWARMFDTLVDDVKYLYRQRGFEPFEVDLDDEDDDE